jgi:hypothetical protein
LDPEIEVWNLDGWTRCSSGARPRRAEAAEAWKPQRQRAKEEQKEKKRKDRQRDLKAGSHKDSVALMRKRMRPERGQSADKTVTGTAGDSTAGNDRSQRVSLVMCLNQRYSVVRP